MVVCHIDSIPGNSIHRVIKYQLFEVLNTMVVLRVTAESSYDGGYNIAWYT